MLPRRPTPRWRSRNRVHVRHVRSSVVSLPSHHTSDLPVDVLAGTNAEAVANRAKSARIRCIMVVVFGSGVFEEGTKESDNYHRHVLLYDWVIGLVKIASSTSY